VNRYIYILLFVFGFGNQSFFAQNQKGELLVSKDSLKSKATKINQINPLAPAKAAFYSALVPGLGQAYNKKYWKIPLVYAALGTSIYAYSYSNSKYHQFRDAYKRRLEGFSDDDLSYLDSGRLISGQKFYQRNRDLSIIITAGIYILNIIDANVDAHLMQFNVNDKLTLGPDIQQNDLNYQQNVALTFNYHF
jgi:Family of unknown function (DUF5683)